MENMEPMVVTADVSHPLRSPLKAAASRNMALMSVTLPVSRARG